jgi:lipopolysaccharide export system protein LptA
MRSISSRYFFCAKGWGLLFISMLFACAGIRAQKKPVPLQDTTHKSSIIQILDNEMGEYIKEGEYTVHKLLGDVQLLHGTDTLYCDSAFFYTHQNSVEAFGNVVIRQLDGTEAFADYMRYTGNTKVVHMRSKGNKEVQLADAQENSLWSKEIEYNLKTKIGKYSKGGQLQTEATILTSESGTYNLNSKEARFKGNVLVSDPEYQAVSVDLGYNTETKVARFFGPSVVTNDQSILQTSNGHYDTRNRTSFFTGRASILNGAQYIEADTLDYDRNSGFGYAQGSVIAIDTQQKSTLYSGYAQYNELDKTLLAYGLPLLKTLNGSDSLFIKADTFFSAPVPLETAVLSAQDSLQRTVDAILGAVQPDDIADPVVTGTDSLSVPDSRAPVLGNDTIPLHAVPDSSMLEQHSAPVPESLADVKQKMDAFVYKKMQDRDTALYVADTSKFTLSAERMRLTDSTAQSYSNTPAQEDTAGPRYFVGYRNVVIYSDSLQGACDSIRYSQQDSLMRMYREPVLWPRNSQLTGDRIYLKLDSSQLKEVHVPHNAIMITRSGPEKAGMFDQVQGNAIKGYLTNNRMDSLVAEPNAASIYYVTEEDSSYVGCSEASAERIEILFEQEEIRTIIYRRDIVQKMIPMKDVEPETMRLSRFKWLEHRRPKSLEEFMEGLAPPSTPQLLH